MRAALPSSSALLIVALLALVVLAFSAPSPAPDKFPTDIKKGSKLYGLQLVRTTSSVLPGFGTGPVDVVEVKPGWVAVTYQGGGGKTNWINLDMIVAYRLER